MALGKRERAAQGELWIASQRVTSSSHPFYEQLNGILDGADFDGFVETLCAPC